MNLLLCAHLRVIIYLYNIFKKQISMMGTLELNANNNEEIKRESAMVRKSRFLRALAKQYLL